MTSKEIQEIKKDKQIRELRDNRDNLFYLGIVFIVFSLFLSGWIGYLKDTTVPDLKSQLQSCQEKVPVWTLKIICYHTNYLGADTYNIIYESNHSNYQNYLNHLGSVEELENCEVLE